MTGWSMGPGHSRRRAAHELWTRLGVAFLVGFLLVGCAFRPSPIASTSDPHVARTPAATGARVAGAATPVPVELTQPPGEDGAVLLREAEQRQAEVRTARGVIELEVGDEGSSADKFITTTIQFEYANPNIRLTAASRDPRSEKRVEMIVTEAAMYLKVGEKWLVDPHAARPTEMKLFGMDGMQSYLATALQPQLEGHRAVSGVACDVIGFELSPEKVKELEDLAAFKRAARDGVALDDYKAEVAVGSEDQLIRRMAFEMRGHDLGSSKQSFVQRVAVTLWDLDSPDIAVSAPAPEDIFDLGALVPPTSMGTAFYRLPLII